MKKLCDGFRILHNSGVSRVLCRAMLLASATLAAAARASDAVDWPVFRGDTQATGVARTTLPASLDVLWTYPVKDGAFEATAVIDNGRVYIGDLDGTFFALRLEDGEELWKHSGEAGIAAAAGVLNDAVYFGDIDGRFTCLDAATGDPRWSFEAGAEINGGPNFHNGRVLFGSQDATLYCLDAKTGDVVWKHTIDDQIRCAPTIVEGRAFLAGCDGKLHIIDVNLGEPIGSVPIDAPTGCTPAAIGKRVYFGTEGAEFLCVDWSEPKVAWRFRAEKSGQSFRSSAAVTDRLVLFGGRDRRLHAVDPVTGDERWFFTTKGHIDSSPVVVGKRVFLASADGRLYEVDLISGEKNWEYDTGSRFTASPAVAAERLVIGSDDGVLYCFGEKKPN